MEWSVTVGTQVRSMQGLGTIETIVDSLVWILVLTLAAKELFEQTRTHVTWEVMEKVEVMK